MELKQYLQIIWKRIWIPVLLVGVVAVASIFNQQTPAPVYGLTLSFSVGITPKSVENEFNYDGNYAWVSSEFLADSLTEFVGGQKFADDINARLAEMGSATHISAGMIAAETKHRILRLTLTGGNPNELADIGQAVIQAVEEDSIKYFPQASNSGASIVTIDTAGPFLANPPSLRQRLDIPIRIILALAAGIALTFLLDYLDDSVRGRDELEGMGIAVLAEVPKK